jgi:hypothetical protein
LFAFKRPIVNQLRCRRARGKELAKEKVIFVKAQRHLRSFCKCFVDAAKAFSIPVNLVAALA